MSRATKKDAVVIVWDVGSSSSGTFLSNSKLCVQKLMGNKLLIQQKDLVSLITFGTEETDHGLDQDGFEHICVNYDLQSANFEMLDLIEKTESSDITGDWLGAMCIALQLLKTSTLSLGKKSIVFVSPLSKDVNVSEFKTIMKGLMKLQIQLIIIGPDINLDDVEEKSMKDEEQIPIDAAIKHLFNQVNGQFWNLEEALPKLTNGYTSRQAAPRPWKIELEIGTTLKIKVAGYNEIASEVKPKFKTLTDKDMDKPVEREKTHFEKGSKRKFVDPEEIIQGHKFGITIVPFSKADKDALEYHAGAMCLKVIGFVSKRHISPAMYCNKNCQMFAPQENDPVSRIEFSALVRAMNQRQLAAIVRKVARNNGRLLFGALLPQIREEVGARLVLVELPFADDSRLYRFKRQQVKVTDDQLLAVDELIDNMNLMTALPDNEEAFPARETPDPTLVHLNETIIKRALFPDCPLPTPSEAVLSILEPPASMKLAKQKMAPSLLAAFNIESQRKQVNRPGTTKRTKASESGQGSVQGDVSSQVTDVVVTQPLMPTDALQGDQRVVVVGTVTPREDFLDLLRQGYPLGDVCDQCVKVVLQLATLANSAEQIEKPLSAVKVMRQSCKNVDPRIYNMCIQQIRSALLDREHTLLWNAICADDLGLVTRHENPLGGVSDQEAEDFISSNNMANNTDNASMDMDDIM